MLTHEKDRKDLAMARKADYKRGLPQAIELQAKLFKELVDAGIIPMIDLLTFPDVVRPLQAPQEQSEEKVLLDKRRKGPRSTLEDIRGTPIPGHHTVWKPHVLLPRQIDDGSIDPTLRIWIEEKTPLLLENTVRKGVDILYSPGGVLTIQGANTMFQDKIVPGVNDDSIEIAFNNATTNPQSIKKR